VSIVPVVSESIDETIASCAADASIVEGDVVQVNGIAIAVSIMAPVINNSVFITLLSGEDL
jgi:hypothetical protein